MLEQTNNTSAAKGAAPPVAFKGRIRIKRIKTETELPALMPGQFCWTEDTHRLFLGKDDGVNELVADPRRLAEIGAMLRQDIDHEKAAREASDAEFQNELDANTAADLTNALADAAERSARIQANQQNTANDAANKVADDAETARAKDADSAHDAAIAAEIARAKAVEAANAATDTLNAQGDAAEVARAKAAEAAIAAADAAETARAKAADAAHDAALANKATNALATPTTPGLMSAADKSKADNTPKAQSQGRASIPSISLITPVAVDIIFDKAMPSTNYECAYTFIGQGLGSFRIVNEVKALNKVTVTLAALVAITAGGTIRTVATELSY